MNHGTMLGAYILNHRMPMKHILAPILCLILALFASPNLAYADSCRSAPAPRLRVGMAAVVAPGIDRLNLRALPAVTTGIESRLYAGTTLTVLSGPSCNGSLNWWRVETAEGVRGWVAEGTWEAYWVIPADEWEHPADPYEWSCQPQVPRICPAPA